MSGLLSARPYLASAKYGAQFKSELKEHIRFQATQRGGAIFEFIGKIKDPLMREEAKSAFGEEAIWEIASRVWAIIQNPSDLSGFNGCLVAAVCLEVGKRLGMDFNSGEADSKLYKGATRGIRAISTGILEKSFSILSGLAKKGQKPKKQDISRFEAEPKLSLPTSATSGSTNRRSKRSVTWPLPKRAGKTATFAHNAQLMGLPFQPAACQPMHLYTPLHVYDGEDASIGAFLPCMGHAALFARLLKGVL